ncbi:MAG: formylglycine-generating enzyme family protein [Deferribacteraceae bacterium]|jgi:formylglycine-generating enzyme required for sulfatase activity|nr:formylglycine-generating enzyme family protein [Deferribacteraceae bacterium]
MGSSSGDDDEKPPHKVTVSSFHIGKYEVTQREWTAIMGNNPSNFKGEELPVEQVSWLDVIEYCNKRSLAEGLTPVYSGRGNDITADWSANGYRLPTEAEWEYAAGGGNKSQLAMTYSGSNNVDAVGWYSGNSGNRTHTIASKQANELGIYDMSGNIWEWVWDWYGEYSGREQVDPVGPVSGDYRVFRGGSWYNDATILRSADRDGYDPSLRYYALGFRVVRH